MLSSRREQMPTLLTLIRVGSIPFLVLILHLPGKIWSWVAALLFFIVGLTDFLDGWLARRMNSVTLLGQYLDPVADKLLISSILIMLTAMNRVAPWITILIVCREIAVTGLRALAIHYSFQIHTHFYGKCKTALQMLGVFLLLIHYPLADFDPQLWGNGTMWLVVFITVWSGLDYAIRFWRLLAQHQSS